MTAVDHLKPGILGWVLGDRSGKTFEPLWILLNQWKCYFYVTDCWKFDEFLLLIQVKLLAKSIGKDLNKKIQYEDIIWIVETKNYWLF